MNKMLGAGAGIACLLALPMAKAQNHEGEVVFYSVAKNLDDVVQNEFRPGEQADVEVHASNKGLNGQKTGQILWDFISPFETVPIAPEGQHYGDNDFFYPLVTELGNKVDLKNSERSTELQLDPFGRDGVADKEGVLAKYRVNIPEDAKEGQYNFKISRVSVYSDVTANEAFKQASFVKNFSIAVKKPESTQPVIALTSDRDHDLVVYVAGNPDKKYAVELTDDLAKGFERVYTNEDFGSFSHSCPSSLYSGNLFVRAVETE